MAWNGILAMIMIITTRRQFLLRCAFSAATAAAFQSAGGEVGKPRPLFDGKTLSGWKAAPRLYAPKTAEFDRMPADQLKAAVVKWHEARPEMQARLRHTGRWEVVDGAIVGGQEAPKLGGYLVSEGKFGDFELELEARPDWPADTGIMLRAHELGNIGFQVLVDHRPKGGIGGVFGNSIGNFLAVPFAVDGDAKPGFRMANLREGAKEMNFPHPAMIHAAKFADFAKAWRANDWNRFRIRCVGALPVITTWINDVKICELDTAKIKTPGYDAEAVSKRLGRAGHIAFEVHDIGPKDPLGADRWAEGAVCRWRNIRLKELP
jgi:hypothetical protein